MHHNSDKSETRVVVTPKTKIELERDVKPIKADIGTAFNVVLMMSVTYEGLGIDGVAETHTPLLFRVRTDAGALHSYTVANRTVKADEIGFVTYSGGSAS